MQDPEIPALSDDEASALLAAAANSSRKRHPKILHNPGDVFNRVINVMLQDSYMQPHLHPGEEKIEHIHLIHGTVAVIFFDDVGAVGTITMLDEKGRKHVAVPAFTWHTYVILTDSAITYETMMGEYEPKTWKEFAQWAPAESTEESADYLGSLKRHATAGSGGG